MSRLEGRTAVVTGGAQGIGRAIALGLGEEGCRVAVADVDSSRAALTARDVEALGVEAVAVTVDLTRKDEIAAAVEKVLARFGRIDILVNNAGWDRMGLFVESDEETWDRILALNFRAMLHVCKAVLPPMIERGCGRIVNVASDAGRVGSSGEAVYSGSKGAVIAFSKALAREVARHGITVNVVCPGLIETGLLQSLRDSSVQNAKILEAVARAIPLGRVGVPADVTGAVVYFASPAAGYVTGQTLSVSGGLTMA
jgi:2-hydroxycyclohexanecarboxyl-CoA dehydrogenase